MTMRKPFAITLDVGSSRANHTGAWRTERPVYSPPGPVTMLSTPGGMMSPISSASFRIDQGVVEAGLITVQLPPASAGASFHAAISSGKLNGMIWPTTPSGSWKW
jgi:hypothetical protein